MRFILKILFLSTAGLFFLWMAFKPGSKDRSTEFDVLNGTTGRVLVKQLKDAGIIQSDVPFRFWMRVRAGGSRIQIGRYRFAGGRSAFWIVDDLIQGRTQKVKVTIPEGFASWQIAERLEAAKICGAEEFKKAVIAGQFEGFLFPATYEFNIGMSPAKVAQTMKADADKRWTSDMERRAAEIGLSRRQVVTLASILEREIRVRDELAQISALYHNRLRMNMRLQADPTVQYAKGNWVARLTYKDYNTTQSPYNTYLHDGLPPGPICSPSQEAIAAALYPAQSDALYMVARDDGRHNFSKTYRDHANKVNRRNRQKRRK